MSYAETRDAAMASTLAAIDHVTTPKCGHCGTTLTTDGPSQDFCSQTCQWHWTQTCAADPRDVYDRADFSGQDAEEDGYPHFPRRTYTRVDRGAPPPFREWPPGTTTLTNLPAILDLDTPVPVTAEVTIYNQPGAVYRDWSALLTFVGRERYEAVLPALRCRDGVVLRAALGEESIIGRVIVRTITTSIGSSCTAELTTAGSVERIRMDPSIYEAHGIEPPAIEDVSVPQEFLDGAAANTSAEAFSENHRPWEEALWQHAREHAVMWATAARAMQDAINRPVEPLGLIAGFRPPVPEGPDEIECRIYITAPTVHGERIRAWLVAKAMEGDLLPWQSELLNVMLRDSVGEPWREALRPVLGAAVDMVNAVQTMTARERALEARRNRNTGPPIRRRGPNRIDPRGER